MATIADKPKRVRKVTAAPIDFQHDALVIRTVTPNDTAFGGFQWPSEIGALVDCPDWNAAPRCGGGFHGLLDGIGDWGLTWRDDGMVWQVAGVIRAECIAVGDDKVKFPRCRLLYRGDKNGALAQIIPALVKAIQGTADAKLASGRGENAAATGYSGHAAATGDRGHAAATGDSGHAAATGDRGHAAATGYRGHAAATGDRGHAAATGDSGHAAATGDRGHAAATGYRGHAAATGYRGHAAATGYRGHAAATGKSAIAACLGIEGTATAGAFGAIVLAYYEPRNWTLQHVGAFMVGQDGIEAGKTYRLNADGAPVEVTS